MSQDTKSNGTQALDGNKNALTDITYTPAKKNEDVLVMPDNSVENLLRTKEIVDARGYLRAKGIADHLYSDDVAVSEFRAAKVEAYHQPHEPDLELEGHFDVKNGQAPIAVKRGDYSTAQGDVVPHYKDKEKADTPTPSDPELPG